MKNLMTERVTPMEDIVFRIADYATIANDSRMPEPRSYLYWQKLPKEKQERVLEK